MRVIHTTLWVLAMLALPRLAAAQDRGSVNFMSGFSVAQGTTLSKIASAVTPGVSTDVNLAGRVNFNIAPGFQALAEVGRFGNVLPPLETALTSLSSYGVRASALYYEGGVRAFASPHSRVNPYVEATAGQAHVNLKIAGIGATADDLVALGLALTSRTSPLAGVGGGVMFHTGRLTFDAGYRYNKIFATNLVDTLLGAGQALTSHQVVFGMGVGF